MRLSPSDLPYVLWALESVLPNCEPDEEEAVFSLLSRLHALAPFSPFSGSSQWRSSVLSSLSQ
jgi:hypothetical protein